MRKMSPSMMKGSDPEIAAAFLAVTPNIVPHTLAFQVIRNTAPSPVRSDMTKQASMTQKLLMSIAQKRPFVKVAPPTAAVERGSPERVASPEMALISSCSLKRLFTWNEGRTMAARE